MSSLKYLQIRAACPAGLALRVLAVLARHVGQDKRITREALVRQMFGRNTNSTDRMTRDAIADLQEAGYPILSSSAAGGYWLASSRSEALCYLAEIEARIVRLSAKRRGILRGIRRGGGAPTLF